MKTQEVYILLTDTSTLLTKAIKLYTKKPYNHASISLDGELQHIYSFGRKRANNPFIGGFVKENPRGEIMREANCAIYSIRVTEGQKRRIKQFILQMEAEKNLYRYNFIGLIAFAFHKQIDRKRAYFCSQFIAVLLQECNVTSFDKPPAFISPADLQTVPCMELVYQGPLQHFWGNTQQEEALSGAF